MLSKSVEKALNDQIAHEFHAAYLYLSMMAYFESESLGGFGHWMRMQAQEEVEHAMRLLDFVLDRGGKVELKALDKPTSDFDSPLAVMEAALSHEQKVTGMINRLYELATDEQDYPTQVLLQWFITEQVEEEKSAGGIVDQLKIAGDSPSALLVLDGKLAERGPEEDEDET
jgi:ferritin